MVLELRTDCQLMEWKIAQKRAEGTEMLYMVERFGGASAHGAYWHRLRRERPLQR
jgi:hypothetical protein